MPVQHSLAALPPVRLGRMNVEIPQLPDIDRLGTQASIHQGSSDDKFGNRTSPTIPKSVISEGNIPVMLCVSTVLAGAIERSRAGSGDLRLLFLLTLLPEDEATCLGVTERRLFCLGEGDTLVGAAFARSGCIFFHAATIFFT